MITIGQFAEVEMRVGLVLECTTVEGSEKLLREVVDIGEKKIIVFSGLKKWYTPDDLKGKKFLYVVNLEPRVILNEESQGMILATDGPDGVPMLISAEGMPVGSKVR